MRSRTLLALPLAAVTLAVGLTTAVSTGAAAAKEPVAGPLVFGHRGASGYRPEHTLAAYDLAIRLGADVIEPDLVSTKDGVLVARHENEIGGTTDVATKFPTLKKTKTIDGTRVEGWFTEDLTIAELRTLRAKERLPLVRQENTVFDGRYLVPTLDEVLALATSTSRKYGRTIGVAPETKHPTYFDGIGLSLEEPLLADLRQARLDRPGSPVYVQSFEEKNLRDLRRLGARMRLVQLTGATGRPYDHVVAGDEQTYAEMTTPAGLREIAQYAQVLGPEKTQIFPRVVASATSTATTTATTTTATTLVRDAHDADLLVVPYTVRAENQFLPAQFRSGADPNAFGNVIGEAKALYATGVDGLFCDQPDLCRVARDEP